ncbi:hypothetical protein C4B68_20590 [Streptomyces dengpaensis]|uniref:Uncharacterized protein n=1 Tax=Streptomyces dengpaensis TaxID=2049881 RepID=A0ABN5I440_9ACTN|nr:hypothetical protein C4B68_20590 [Streptomyces dengpaensis]PIB03487.1 hypothetical protein B1C81_36950 [Streptomyces sp. HG99]
MPATTIPTRSAVPVLLRAAELNKGEPGNWGFEGEQITAAYDPAQISRADAETRLRAQMNAKGITVSAFVDTDGRPADEAREHTEHTESPLTPEQTTLVLDEGLGAWVTAPVETALRDIDDQRTARENAEVPFLAAQMVVSDYRPQAYGRHTEVWLSAGTTIGSLTPAKARQALEAMRGFVDQLEAVVTLAEETAAGDFEGDPEVYRLDREAEERRTKAISEARLKAIAEGRA